MKFIKRDILSKLEAHLQQKEITLLLGPRQVGKTTLLKLLAQSLSKQKMKVLYLNLDIEQDFEHLESQQQLIRYIQLNGGAKTYIFIDEIQRKKNAGRFIKGIYDMGLPHKIILSGSGSLELKEDVIESLAGRKRVFEINPISFFEFVHFKTNYTYSDNLLDWLELNSIIRKQLIDEYLIFGGYPDVVLATSIDEKKARLQEIYQSYMERDINTIINIDKPEAFSMLFQLLSSMIGYTINYAALSKKVGLSDHTVKQYIWYMQKTYMIDLAKPYYQNPQKELVKAPVIYFKDLGMCSYMLKNWEVHISNRRLGMTFQNFIVNEIISRLTFHERPKFWRTKDGAEVDVVLGNIYNPIPVEIKYSNLKKLSPTPGLRKFINNYKPDRSYIINLSLKGTTKYHHTTISTIPFWKLNDIEIP